MTIKNTLVKAGRKVAKHSPVIFTSVGIVGLGATAYLAYKSREKVEAVVEGIEETRAVNGKVDKVQVTRDIVEAVYLPVIVGVVSATSILMAHKIQNKRIAALVGALAAEQARNIYFESKYRKKHGDDEYRTFMTPTDEVTITDVNKQGKAKITIHEVKKDIDKTIGQWYDQSSEYASDDHGYNVAFLEATNERMQTLLFQRGTLLLNEVREALGFERIKNGALLGWTTSDSFDIERVVTALGDEEAGELKEQVWVTWTRPRYVYDDVEFNGRYSVL